MVRNLSSLHLVSIMAHSRKRFSKKNNRYLRLESLERRNLLAGDVFHNYLSPGDVNNDNQVSAIDALTVINHLRRTEASGEGEHVGSSAFADVNDDGRTTAIDALMVINQLRRGEGESAAAGDELEARISGASGERAKVEIENEHGGLKLEVKIQNALPGESYDVTIGSSVVATLVTNSRGRASLETFLTGAAADTAAAANTGTSVSISGIGVSVFVGDHSGDNDHDDNDSHDNDHEDTDHDGSDHQDDDDHSNDADSNDSDSDDDLSNSGSSDSSNHDDSSDDGSLGSSDHDSSGNDTDSDDADSIDDDDDHADHSSDSDSDSDNDDGPVTPAVSGTTYGEWKARLTGTGSGKAEFEIERGEMEFEVEVQGFAANSTYPVSVGGVVIGQLRTNSRGKGELEFEVGDDDHRPFPANFPTITAGTSVSVGDRVSGVFAAKTNDHDGDDHDDD